MDVSGNVDLKGVALPTVPPLDRKGKSQGETKPVKPVKPSGDSVKSSLDEQKLSKQQKGMATDQLTKTTQEIQKRLDDLGTTLSFSVDKETDSIVIQVKDKKSGELVRQIPSQEMLDLKVKLEKLMGILFDHKV